MAESFSNMKSLTSELIKARLESVKELVTTDLEAYEIMKDSLTGEHYLHYAYLHRDIASGGAEEEFHQLMPIETDDVLGFIFGEQEYKYPQNWHKSFLRNGPDGSYVWFDPSYAKEELTNEQLGHQLNEALAQFKLEGTINEESIRKLMEKLDKIMDE